MLFKLIANNEWKVKIDYEQDIIIYDHVIDNLNIFPTTAYIYIMWRLISDINGRQLSETRLILEKFKIQRKLIISRQEPTIIKIYFAENKFVFEIDEKCYLTSNAYIGESNVIKKFNANIVKQNQILLNSNDFYKELRIRGYEFGPNFRNVVSVSSDGTHSIVRRHENLMAFLDSILQLAVLGDHSRHKLLPVGIEYAELDPSITKLSKNTYLRVNYNKQCKTVTTMGLKVIASLALTKRKWTKIEPTTGKYIFVSYNQKKLQDLTMYLECRKQTIDSLISIKQVQLSMLARNYEFISYHNKIMIDKYLEQTLRPMFDIITLETRTSKMIYVEEIRRNSVDIRQAIVNLMKKFNRIFKFDYLMDSDRSYVKDSILKNLIIINKLIKAPKYCNYEINLDNVFNNLTNNGFLLLLFRTKLTPLERIGFKLNGIEFDVNSVNEFVENCLKIGFTIIGEISDSMTSTAILMRKVMPIRYIDQTFIKISDSFETWIPILKNKLKEQNSKPNGQNIWLENTNNGHNGIIGLISSLKHDEPGHNLRCVNQLDRKPHGFKFDEYNQLLKRNLVYNIKRDDRFGYFANYYSTLDESSVFSPRTDRLHMIVGGLGGAGLETCDWLIGKGARSIVLTTSRGITNDYQRYRLNIMRSFGARIIVVNNATKYSSDVIILYKTIHSIAKLSSLFNCSLRMRDKLFRNQNAEMFREVVEPKRESTLNLDTISRYLCYSLEYFVVFSSVVSGVGNIGQTNYGFGSSSMERICESRRRDGLHGLAIQWGAIGDVGMVAENMPDKQSVAGLKPQKISSVLEVVNHMINCRDSITKCCIPINECNFHLPDLN